MMFRGGPLIQKQAGPMADGDDVNFMLCVIDRKKYAILLKYQMP